MARTLQPEIESIKEGNETTDTPLEDADHYEPIEKGDAIVDTPMKDAHQHVSTGKRRRQKLPIHKKPGEIMTSEDSDNAGADLSPASKNSKSANDDNNSTSTSTGTRIQIKITKEYKEELKKECLLKELVKFQFHMLLLEFY